MDRPLALDNGLCDMLIIFLPAMKTAQRDLAHRGQSCTVSGSTFSQRRLKLDGAPKKNIDPRNYYGNTCVAAKEAAF